ncbi:MAG TPA: hypothetical protein VFZ40_01970 [Pyrinomonadaceae bacterium]
MSKLTARLPLIAVFLVMFASFTAAQEATPDAAKQQEEKAKLEAKAAALLEQIVSESQGLKLPDNRIRVAVVAGDLLWDRSPARARTFFTDAASILANTMAEPEDSERREFGMLNALRRELVLSAARHDAELAYQLLRQTQPPAGMNDGNRRLANFRFPDDNLEQALLIVIAASDPKVAYQKAAESLDKGEYPVALSRVLSQLQAKDEEAFKKLSEKTLNRLSSENLLTSGQAVNVAMSLLRPGPQAATTSPSPATAANSRANNSRVLTESAFQGLLNNAVTAALTATPRTNAGGGNSQGRTGRGQRRQGVMMGSGDGPVAVYMEPPRNNQQQLDPAQIQQNNARMLLRNLQGMLPQIDQYVPERGQAVRQKLTELGMGNNSMRDFANQMRNVMQQGDSESLAAAASTAPAPIQSRLYREAATRAVDEGNTERALQLANDHLDESGRASVMQAIDFKKITTNVSAEKLNEIRQKLAALPSDADRVKYLGDLVAATQKDNPKLALRFAEDARAIVTKRASDYRDLENQIRVAELFASLDPKRSFEVLEPGIAQLNELLTAAQVLNGFEVHVFRDGELPLQGGSELGRVVARFGQQLAALAKVDFERAQATADRFQFAEPRLMSKLSIVQGAFGVRQPSPENSRRFDNIRFMTR